MVAEPVIEVSCSDFVYRNSIGDAIGFYILCNFQASLYTLNVATALVCASPIRFASIAKQ